MKASEIFPQIAKEKKVTLEQIAKAMDRLFPSVWRSMKNDNAPMSFFVECAEVLGYEIVVQPKSAGKRKEGSYVLTANDSGRSEEELIRLAKERELYELERKAAEIRKDLKK